MSIVIFIVILAVLIFVHELGHFIAAKKSGVRVDEFAIGFPPRIFSFKRGGTVYSINLIPFGGYVSIFGENPDESSLNPEQKDSFVNKPKWVQAWILSAGVIFNAIFAWIILSICLMIGMPSALSGSDAPVENSRILITSVLDNSPAEEADLRPGDEIVKLRSGDEELRENVTVEGVQQFIRASEGNVSVTYERNGSQFETSIEPEIGLAGDNKVIGISMGSVGTLRYSNPFIALWEGLKMTGMLAVEITVGLGTLIADAFRGQGDFAAVTGPVGIVGLVEDASQFGIVYLLAFTAFISIHLAVINLLPFPALDGGRILFVIIEAIKRSPINPKVANTLNVVGFGLLILLMIAITISDVIKLF